MLTLVKVLNERRNKRIAGEFLCDCGNVGVWAISRVKSGIRRHCGCEANTTPGLTHGMRMSPEYRSWQAMKGRCLSPTHKDYPRDGGSGVTVFRAWEDSFEAFYAHVGPRPEGTTLDRINTRGNYEPGNVRWATPKIQATNRTNNSVVSIRGRIYPSIADAARAHNVSETTIVRWCDGYFDARRNHIRPPISGCSRKRAYQ
jgi:hypothetical protein